MKSFLYIINRFKTANLLNLLGLTVAFAAFYLFMTQVQYSNQYNTGLYDYKNLYRLEAYDMSGKRTWIATTPRPMVEYLSTQPQVKDLYMYQNSHQNNTLTGKEEISCHYTTILPGSMKSLRPIVLDGTLEMHAEDEAIITESVALACLQNTQVAGKHLKAFNGNSVTIVGVIQDFPENCVVQNGIFINLHDHDRVLGNWNYNCLVHLSPQADTLEIANRLRDWYIRQRIGGDYTNATQEDIEEITAYLSPLKFRFTPVSKTYVSGVDPIDDKGNKGMQMVLSLACVLVIIVAAINFTNFSLAQTPVRIKSVNTRKVLGQSIASLRMGMIGEGMCIALVAWLLSMTLCQMLNAIPSIRSAFLGTLAFNQHIDLFMLTLLIAVSVGIMASVYPAWYATSFNPALVLKGAFGLSPRGLFLRKVLVGVQITIAIIMMCYIGILALQSRYIYQSDYGFDKDQILITTLPNRETQSTKDRLRKEIMKLPGVENVCFSQFIPGVEDLIMWWGRGMDEKTVYFNTLPVDWHFLNTYGIPVIEGQNFSEHDSDVYIVNQTMKNEYDWIEMDKLLIEGDLPVKGVCRNFRLFSMRKDSATPTAFIIYGERYPWPDPCRRMSIRVSEEANRMVLKKQIEDAINSLLHTQSTQVDVLDELMDSTYEEEFRFIRQVDVFCTLCVIITLIGVFCLTMFETEFRRKEIGVRRVLGSSTAKVLLLFNRQYLELMMLSFFIAMPFSYRMGSEWLSNFAEHTPIYWWLFPASLLTVGTVTVLTVSIETWRVAHENPVNSIKTD